MRVYIRAQAATRGRGWHCDPICDMRPMTRRVIAVRTPSAHARATLKSRTVNQTITRLQRAGSDRQTTETTSVDRQLPPSLGCEKVSSPNASPRPLFTLWCVDRYLACAFHRPVSCIVIVGSCHHHLCPTFLHQFGSAVARGSRRGACGHAAPCRGRGERVRGGGDAHGTCRSALRSALHVPHFSAGKHCLERGAAGMGQLAEQRL